MSSPTVWLPRLLGFAWGLLLSVPILVYSARGVVATRSIELSTNSSLPAKHPLHFSRNFFGIFLGKIILVAPGPLRRVSGDLVARRHQSKVTRATEVELPVTIDLLTVAISAGCTPYLAVEAAARWAPVGMAEQLTEVRRACALGWGFGRALSDWSQTVPPVAGLVQALLISDRTGAPVLDALIRLASEQRAAVRRRSETRARTVPVRLLFPLIFLILPAFGLLTVAPALLAGFSRT